jgi:hypothetical protein
MEIDAPVVGPDAPTANSEMVRVEIASPSGKAAWGWSGVRYGGVGYGTGCSWFQLPGSAEFGSKLGSSLITY